MLPLIGGFEVVGRLRPGFASIPEVQWQKPAPQGVNDAWVSVPVPFANNHLQRDRGSPDSVGSLQTIREGD